jgi:hypothetical protein
MAWSVVDLWSITDDLLTALNNCIQTSPIWKDNGGTVTKFDIFANGSMPETVRKETTCQLSLYLLHVGQDKFYRNAPVGGGPGQTNKRQPLSLELYYLLTAFADKNAREEQEAMSIALRCFHERAIVKTASEEYTLTMEAQSADEMSRLWQALATPLRLSAVYKVSIVFMTPSEAAPAPGPPPTKIGLSVSPTILPLLGLAQVFGVSSQTNLIVPTGATRADVDKIGLQFSPPVAEPGDIVLMTGAALDIAGFEKVYLTSQGGVEQDISTWKQPGSSASELRLKVLPENGPVQAGGVYLVSIGSDLPTKIRSNTTPLMIAARIDSVGVPPKLIPDGSGFYTVQGVGFIPGVTEVYMDTVRLIDAGGTPNPGQFQITGGGTGLTFKAFDNMESGRYWLRVRVNGVESRPSWYVEI